MKKVLVIISVGVLSIFTGCGSYKSVSVPKPQSVKPNRAPVSLIDVLNLGVCPSKSHVLTTLGEPQSADEYNWYYPVKDSALKNSIQYKLSVRGDVLYQLTDIEKLEFKIRDASRNKFYRLLYMKRKAECDYNSQRKFNYNMMMLDYKIPSHMISRREKESMERSADKRDTDLERIQDKKEKYTDKLYDFKEDLENKRGSIPEWWID